MIKLGRFDFARAALPGASAFAGLLVASAAGAGIAPTGEAIHSPSGVASRMAARAAVLITDTGFRPRIVRISTGGRVTWTNRGQRPHVVVSLSGAFRAFALTPGGARTVTFRRSGSHPYLVDAQCGVVLVGVARGACPRTAGGGGRNLAYRAVASLSVNERFPTITGDCRSTGSRQVEWTASVPRLLLFKQSPPSLGTVRRGAGRFETFESRVVSPCPGAFENRFGGTPFRLAISWQGSDNRLAVSTETAPLDEGEGSGWTYLGCRNPELTTAGVELTGTPYYTGAFAKLTSAERRMLLAHKPVRVRRAVAASYDASTQCSGFGGDKFEVRISLDVRLIPVRR